MFGGERYASKVFALMGKWGIELAALHFLGLVDHMGIGWVVNVVGLFISFLCTFFSVQLYS